MVANQTGNHDTNLGWRLVEITKFKALAELGRPKHSEWQADSALYLVTIVLWIRNTNVAKWCRRHRIGSLRVNIEPSRLIR